MVELESVESSAPSRLPAGSGPISASSFATPVMLNLLTVINYGKALERRIVVEDR